MYEVLIGYFWVQLNDELPYAYHPSLEDMQYCHRVSAQWDGEAMVRYPFWRKQDQKRLDDFN
jgi:hypothetical protein